MAKEQIEKQIKPRRSSVTYKQDVMLEDVDIDEFHCGGDNVLLDQMKDYVNKEYAKRLKGIGRLKFKKFWKKVRGKDFNEEKEKEHLREKFILEHLSSEQKKLFSQELLEAKLDEEDADAEENNPKFEIIPRLAAGSKGT